MASMSKGSRDKDTVVLGPLLGCGHRPALRILPDGTPQAGFLGSDLPTADSVVELKHIEGPTYEVVSEVKLTARGPSQVASRAYRDGWSNVFGAKPTVDQAN